MDISGRQLSLNDSRIILPVSYSGYLFFSASISVIMLKENQDKEWQIRKIWQKTFQLNLMKPGRMN